MIASKGIKKVAAMCIVHANGQYLLMKRFYPPNRGKYVSVGGKVEPFERPIDAAKRELKEEAGVEIENLDYCGLITETSPTDYNWIAYIFKVNVPYFEPPECTEGQWVWLSKVALSALPTPITSPLVYDYIERGIIFTLDVLYDENMQVIDIQQYLFSSLKND